MKNPELEGIYKMSKVNQTISLYEDEIIFAPKNSIIKGYAKFILKFIPPLPRIQIEAQVNAYINIFGAGMETEVSFLNVKSTDVYIKLSSGPNPWIIEAVIKKPVLIGSDSDISKVIFHLPNFPDFVGKSDIEIKKKNGTESRGHVSLSTNEFIIDVIAVEGLKNKYGSLNYYEHGYIITHIGQVFRKDGNDFSLENFREIDEIIHYFFSFCAGYFTGPILPVGLDKKKVQVWKLWSTGLCSPFISTLSWFDLNNGQLMEEVFPGFYSLWLNKIWNKSIKTAIYWYLRSNMREGGVDGAVILAQAALELICYTYFVEDKKIFKYEDFKNKSAKKKIDLVLSDLGIPTDLPPILQDLYSLGQNYSWNGPQAITEVRNFLVHPGQPKRLKGKILPLSEVWRLSLWYIELIFLRLFNHQGYYYERLKFGRNSGDVIKVPWAK